MSSKPNEAYHHVLWGLAPKDSYCSTQELKLAVNISRVCIFQQRNFMDIKEISLMNVGL